MKDIIKAIVFGGIFVVPFLVLNVQNDMFFPYITGKNFLFRIIVECIFAGWVILALYEPQYRPKFSWILSSFTAFLAVMFFANLFGENRNASFWSNFERMDGYVTLVHTFLYILVLGSVLTAEKLWYRFFITTTVAAILLSFYAFAQKAGYVEHRYGGFRVDATLGNATYMAVYMLFHVAIVILLMFKSDTFWKRIFFGALAILFSYLLIQTATRGTTLGLLTFFIVGGTYIALFGRAYPVARKIASYGLVAIIVIVVAFISVRKTEYVQNNPTLTRIANISLQEGGNRFNIWSMAFEGVKERPLLGWGQSNYNYVFNKYYRPELHEGEAWFDRVHNIVMDWLIAGGFFGLITYFSILGSALYYLFFRPLFKKDDNSFTVVERGVLIGLLSGYLVHNIFVFDNVVSYIFYGTILAYIHARVAIPCPKLTKYKMDVRIVEQVVTPVVCIIVFVVVYSVNVPGIRAAKDIIKAFQTNDSEQMLQYFEEALANESFGTQEIREQMTQKAQGLLSDKNAPDAIKQKFKTRVEEELLKEEQEKPNDARIEVFISSFYRATGEIDKAITHLERARELSPRKQIIIFEQGFAYLQKQEVEKAMSFFKEAYELGPQFMEPRVLYAMSALYAGKTDVVNELIQTDEQKRALAMSDYGVQAAYATKQYSLLIELINIRIAQKPEDKQERANLAFILNESGDVAGAVEVLKKAAEDIPEFKDEAEQYMQSIVSKNLGITEGGGTTGAGVEITQ